MKVQAIIVLSLVAAAVAMPDFRSRRATNDSSTVGPPVDCGSGSPSGLGGLLSQVSNLLVNLLTNVGKLRLAGLLGDNRDLIDLKGLLGQVSNLLLVLLGGSTNDDETASNANQLSSTVKQITDLLNNVLGSQTGDKYACTKSGGIVGGLLDSVLGTLTGVLGIDLGLLSPLLKPILDAVTNLLRSLS